MEDIIGISAILAVFIITLAGVIIGQFLRWGQSSEEIAFKKLAIAGIITWFSSVGVVIGTISALPENSDILLQWLIFIGEIGAIAGLEYIATAPKRVISRMQK